MPWFPLRGDSTAFLFLLCPQTLHICARFEDNARDDKYWNDKKTMRGVIHTPLDFLGGREIIAVGHDRGCLFQDPRFMCKVSL